MPQPKVKLSRSRRGNRRSHHRIEIPAKSVCQKCGEFKLPHHVCKNCGFYNKEMKVLEVEEV